jgi:hypothetical protein
MDDETVIGSEPVPSEQVGEGEGSDPVEEAEDFLKRAGHVLQVERGLKGVLKGSDAIRAHMLAGDLEAGTDGMNALTEFVESVPAHFTARILFVLANQVLHGDAFTKEDV